MNTLDKPAVPDTEEEFYTKAEELGQRADSVSWEVGRYAEELGKKYGEDKIGTFAKRSNRWQPSTVRQYRGVYKFWQSSTLVSKLIVTPGISYTHFRNAMVAGNVDDAEAWLLEAADKTMSASEMLLRINDEKGKTVKVTCADVDTQVRVDPVSGLLFARIPVENAKAGDVIQVKATRIVKPEEIREQTTESELA